MSNKTTIGRLLCLLLALCLSLSVWPATVAAAEVSSANVAIDETNFPDPQFRNYIKKFDQNQDGVLDKEECNSTTYIDVRGNQIKTLQGIEHFPSLQKLNCNRNQITALDVSKNPALVLLSCNENQISSLDVSKNPALDALSCNNNKLTALDVSKNTALQALTCCNNQLTTLNIGKNAALVFLDCNDNQLTALDVRENPALLDLSCDINRLSTLDVRKNTALLNLICDENRLTALDVSKNTALEGLGCGLNQLSTLDVSKNPSLKMLYCNGNRLSTLDLQKNTALTHLDCSENQLTSLDLSNHPSLSYLYAEGNRYPLPQKTDFDYTTLPGSFDIRKISDVVGGSFDPETHTFRFDEGKTCATYTYDMGNNHTETFTLHFNPFQDVKLHSFYYDSVLWAVSSNITDGTTPTTFSPDRHCTRGQIVTFLWRAAGSPRPESYDKSPFRDVQDSSKFYYEAVLWAAENGITSGVTADTFNPKGVCNRGQVVTFLWRFKDKPQPQNPNSSFVDVQNTSKFYYNAVLWAAENNITDGVAPNVFRPEGICKRGQIVTFLYRCLN